MCGICGKYNPAGVEASELKRMSDTLAHRGPDDEGWYVAGPIGLACRRLSIIDLKQGRMPISNEDGSVWIVYNGEIYNYRELRKELLQRGHTFKTHTDTEVVVHLYEEMGERCVERLNGMFAFAIWDAARNKLMLARDRIGQKPLYYARDNEGFLFASELKAILAVRHDRPQTDYQALHHYLSLRFIPPPLTMVRGIEKLPPASVLSYQDGDFRITKYWELSFAGKEKRSDEEWVDGLRENLQHSIRSHMVSDVPVGAFLSGGLDSSMIVAMAGNDLNASLDTFAVGVEASDFNELPYARLVAERYQTRHVEQCVTSDLIQLLPTMIWHLDEPSDPIAACQFHAARLASQHVKVVLGGDGGDELFAGFDRYLGVGYIDYYTLLPALFREKILGPLIERMPDSFTYKSIAQKAQWLNHLSTLPDLGERYAEATCFFRYSHADKSLLFGDDLWKELRDLNAADTITESYRNAPADDPLDRMLYADFMTRLPEHSLMLSDRMSMAHSLEVRSPYLDHKLVEFMAAAPSSLKIKNRQLKYVLRRLAADYLPDSIVKREKQGFMFPVAYWFRGELFPLLQHVLLNSHFVRHGIFRKKQVNRLLHEHRNNRIDHHVRLWMLLNLEIWHRLYIEEQERKSVEEQLIAEYRVANVG